jgi:putative ABC transport system permease protein
MITIWQDIRYGSRMLARKPVFTTLAVLTLALGIGANTAIFSVVDAVLLRQLPYRNPGQLVQLWQTESAPGNYPLTGQDFLDWRAQNRTFEDMAVYSFQESFNLSGTGEPERVTGVQVQANFFSILGIQPVLGRPFLQGDATVRQNLEVLLSYGFWQRHFAGQASVVGSAIELNTEPYRIVGVMPRWYRIPAGGDLWIPIDTTPKSLGGRGSHHLRALGRIRDGVTIEQARADLLAISTNLEKQFPDTNDKVHSVIVPLAEQVIGDSRSQLWVLFGAVTLVLLIACANVANLLLARATDRQHEIALRAALGAKRRRLVRQMLTESTLLAVLGAVPGIALAYPCVSLLANAQQMPFPQANPIQISPTVLAFTLAVSIAVGVLFGLAPALQISGINLMDELKTGGKMAHTASNHGRLVRNSLVAAEIALSLSLLAGAALLLRTFANLRAVDVGARVEKVLTASVQLPAKKYQTVEQTLGFCSRLVESLAAAPGVHTAALTTDLPVEGGSNGYIKVDGLDDRSTEGQLVEQTCVTPEYFHALGIPLIQGRGLTGADMDNAAAGARQLLATQSDGQSQAPPPNFRTVALINRTMARRFWPNQDPTGKVFRIDWLPIEVIGVVGDTKRYGLRQAPVPQAYLPFPLVIDVRGTNFKIIVQTAGPPQTATGAIRSTVQSLDGSLAVYRMQTMAEFIANSMADDSQQTLLLSSFAALALILAGVGTYGVMSYLVTLRTGEIGIRIALGAGRGDVLWMVLREGLTPAIAGIGIGLAATFATSRLLESLLFGVKANDPLTLAAASIVMVAVAIMACVVPAMGAMRVDPAVALRQE